METMVRDTPRTNQIRRRPLDEPQTPMASAAQPAREEIERRAYELYLERGAADGGDVDDWLHAERELNRSGDTTLSSTVPTSTLT